MHQLTRQLFQENQNEAREQIKMAARDSSLIGSLHSPSHEAKLRNPLCGDEVEVSIRLDNEDRIVDLKAEIRGCLVARAAWTLTAKALLGRSRSESVQFLKVLAAELEEADAGPHYTALPSPMTSLLSYRLPSPRHSCATLGSQAILKALEPKNCNQ